MRKEVESIMREKELTKTINKKRCELMVIRENCKHEVIVEISYINLNYGYACNEFCLFCGEKLHRYLDYKYKFSFINSVDKYLPVYDKEYILVQKLFIEFAKSNSDMSLENTCEAIQVKIKEQNINCSLLKNPLK